MWRLNFLKQINMSKEIKYRLGTVRKVPTDGEESRTVEFVISDESKDRHGSIIKMSGWNLDNFNNNGIVGYQHNVYGGDMCNAPDPDQVIGRGEAFVEGMQLIGRVTFETEDINPLAEKIFKKIKFGTLRATSVGFMATSKGYYGEGDESEGGKNETYYYDGQELVEFSIVNIPSNKNALKRSLRDQTANALMFINRELGGEMSFSDIEKLTVGEVIRKLNREGLERDHTENKDNEIIEKQRIEKQRIEVQQQKMDMELKLIKLNLKEV